MIDVQNLCKDYVMRRKEPGLRGAIRGLVRPEHKKIHAVSDLSFHIDDGEIVGFIGPNGAGKSTTIKMMSGILTPTKGCVLIDGRDISKHRKEVVRNIGVVFGQRSQLNWDLRLGESFMLHSPGVLFLDEPTIGLDVSAKYALRKFIKEINRTRRTTVILTTHDLGDIQELCERLIIINHGVMMEDGRLSEIVDRIAPYKTLVVEYYDESAPEHDRCEMTEHSGNVAKYRFIKNEVTAAEIIADLSRIKTIKDVSIEEAGIDDIIKIAYGQSG